MVLLTVCVNGKQIQHRIHKEFRILPINIVYGSVSERFLYHISLNIYILLFIIHELNLYYYISKLYKGIYYNMYI